MMMQSCNEGEPLETAWPSLLDIANHPDGWHITHKVSDGMCLHATTQNPAHPDSKLHAGHGQHACQQKHTEFSATAIVVSQAEAFGVMQGHEPDSSLYAGSDTFRPLSFSSIVSGCRCHVSFRDTKRQKGRKEGPEDLMQTISGSCEHALWQP